MELMSTTVFPLLNPCATPLSENSAASTCGVSGTIVMMISDFCATSLPLAHATPPASTNVGGTLGML